MVSFTYLSVCLGAESHYVALAAFGLPAVKIRLTLNSQTSACLCFLVQGLKTCAGTWGWGMVSAYGGSKRRTLVCPSVLLKKGLSCLVCAICSSRLCHHLSGEGLRVLMLVWLPGINSG